MTTDRIAKSQRERRELLRRFAAVSDDALTDAELLELYLATDTGRSQASALPRRLLKRFGSLAKVMSAETPDLLAVKGVTEEAVQRLRMLKMLLRHILRSEINERPAIWSWSALIDYSKLTTNNGKVEEMRVLFLDGNNSVIADERLWRGTVNHTPVYPREIIARALELGAAALILLHNHPVGDPRPSQADIDITYKIVEAAATMAIKVHDHVIIADIGHYSFRSFGLLGDTPKACAAAQQPGNAIAAAPTVSLQ